MRVDKFACQALHLDPRVFALPPDGNALLFYDDASRTGSGIAKFSKKDAAKYAQFAESLETIAEVFKQLSSITPPAIDKPSPEDFWNLFKTGRGVRRLGKSSIFNLLRSGPMALAHF